MADATLKQIKEFFGMNNTDFARDWKALDEDEKNYFKTAVAEVL